MKHFQPKGVIRILGEKYVRPGSKGSRQWLVLKQFEGKTVDDFHRAAQLSTRLKPHGTYQTSNWWVRELDYCWHHGVVKVEAEKVTATDRSNPASTANLPSETDGALRARELTLASGQDAPTATGATPNPGTTKTGLDLKATGIYIAYPTVSVLKPIYRGYATKVNNEHTKVGMAQDSFHARRKGYINAFGGEVEFLPIAEIRLDVLVLLELKNPG